MYSPTIHEILAVQVKNQKRKGTPEDPKEITRALYYWTTDNRTELNYKDKVASLGINMGDDVRIE